MKNIVIISILAAIALLAAVVLQAKQLFF